MKHITLLASALLTLSATAQIADGSFEAGPGSGAWTEASTNFSTPFCNNTCSANPTYAPFNGDWYLWFGGAGAGATLPEVASVEQSCTIPTGTDVTLAMWVKYPNAGVTGDQLDVSIDGTVVGSIMLSDSDAYLDYTGIGFDINAYAGGTHTVNITGTQTSASNIWNVLVDQVEILADGASVGLFENESQPGMQVFPNPANEQLTMTFNALSGRAMVTISDMNGRFVSRQELGQVNMRTFTYDSKQLPNGVYVVSVENAGKTYTQRVVIAH